VGTRQYEIDAETTLLRARKHSQYDLNWAVLAEVWQYGRRAIAQPGGVLYK
jgi:hypothetical protein